MVNSPKRRWAWSRESSNTRGVNCVKSAELKGISTYTYTFTFIPHSLSLSVCLSICLSLPLSLSLSYDLTKDILQECTIEKHWIFKLSLFSFVHNISQIIYSKTSPMGSQFTIFRGDPVYLWPIESILIFVFMCQVFSTIHCPRLSFISIMYTNLWLLNSLSSTMHCEATLVKHFHWVTNTL